MHASTPKPEAGAQCGNPARWDLCGGPPVRAVPTAILESLPGKAVPEMREKRAETIGYADTAGHWWNTPSLVVLLAPPMLRPIPSNTRQGRRINGQELRFPPPPALK